MVALAMCVRFAVEQLMDALETPGAEPVTDEARRFHVDELLARLGLRLAQLADPMRLPDDNETSQPTIASGQTWTEKKRPHDRIRIRGQTANVNWWSVELANGRDQLMTESEIGRDYTIDDTGGA